MSIFGKAYKPPEVESALTTELVRRALITPERAAEHAKYARAYALPGYRMHGDRLRHAQDDLKALPVRGSLLDVGCGRGELLEFAESIGFGPVMGTETVPALLDPARGIRFAEGHDLPFADQTVDVVICNDVIEHVLPGDDELLCRELARVAKSYILITANNAPSKDHIGEELHINKRPYKEWDALFRDWFGPHAEVIWIPTDKTHETERWRIAL